MTRAKIIEFFQILSAANPAPETELNYSDPYTLLVAVTLSAQATDISVNKATANLFPTADTPEKMIALGEKKLGEYIQTIGLWRNKAKNVIALSQMLLDDYNGEVPHSRDELMKLPGVGRKTANVVCNTAFGQPTIAVDTHIFRVANRTGLARGKNVEEVEARLEKVIPKEFILNAHHWLILHGRYICKARTPECWHCPVSEQCLFSPKTPEGGFAKTKKKTKKKAARKMAHKPKLKETKPT
ncbi:MAG: endonuclease III [bacterium]